MNIFILLALLSFMDTDTADTIISTKDMSRAIRRHNTYVAINRKKAKKTCRKGSGNWCPQPWWNEVDENGEHKKPALGGNKSGNIQHKSQQHRWDTYTYSSKKNTWKKTYDAFEIEKQKYFDKVDTREEELYAKKSADFAKYLIEEENIANEADALLNEFEKQCYEKYCYRNTLMDNGCIPYGDINYPGVIYLVEPEATRSFIKHMEENGAYWYICTEFEDNWDIKHVVGVRTHRNPGLVFG